MPSAPRHAFARHVLVAFPTPHTVEVFQRLNVLGAGPIIDVCACTKGRLTNPRSAELNKRRHDLMLFV